MTLADLNKLDRPAFVKAVGWVFEDSPWVAERAWVRRPFRNLDHLHEAMVKEAASATRSEQLALLRAHPDLGTRLNMSAASQREQLGAKLSNLTETELKKFRELNAAYREKFGIPFLYAVKDSTKRDILNALESRRLRPVYVEHAEALTQVYRIARFRLEETIS